MLKEISISIFLITILSSKLFSSDEKLCLSLSGGAVANASTKLSSVPLFYYDIPLGVYDVNLQPTLSVIKHTDKLSRLPLRHYPYYKNSFSHYRDKKFKEASKRLRTRQIYEFNVPPFKKNFRPKKGKNIRLALEGASQKSFQNKRDWKALRGTVRILTDFKKRRYIYTVDHYKTFSEPRKFPIEREK